MPVITTLFYHILQFLGTWKLFERAAEKLPIDNSHNIQLYRPMYKYVLIRGQEGAHLCSRNKTFVRAHYSGTSVKA